MIDLDEIVSLCKRRGFIFPGSQIYGGLANAWDYGPLGAELKNNIKQLWWRMFVREREDMLGLDAALLMNTRVWEASGHLSEFSDPLVECKKCHNRFRADHLGVLEGDPQKISCPSCGAHDWTTSQQFNLMLKTFLGPSEDQAHVVYFRPETAQAMFVNFKQIMQASRKNIPFGIAQIGKAFRNEITPGNFIFRTREFDQMEIEYFIQERDWEEQFEHWRMQMNRWIVVVGINPAAVHETEIPKAERAHYSKRTIDFEFDFPFGRKELYGLAYRGDFDLSSHEKASGEDLHATDPATGEKFLPHVIEPSWGLDRTVLAVLCSSYRVEEGDKKRIVLSLPTAIAPYKAAVFPLLANKPELVDKAREIFKTLQREFSVDWDDRGNIGKRYFAQDEIGTPYCLTVDFDTLTGAGVTVRRRDSMEQTRMSIDDFINMLRGELARPD